MKTKILENNITNIPYDNKVFKHKALFDPICLKDIDTNAIYKAEFGYQTTENSYENIYKKKYYQSSSVRGYYKFYVNGCVNRFSFRNFNEIDLSSINPNFDGSRGVLYLETNEIKVDLFTTIGYGYGREYGITTDIIKVKGDTIFEKSIKDYNYVNVYVKRKLPKEFLIYKPDW